MRYEVACAATQFHSPLGLRTHVSVQRNCRVTLPAAVLNVPVYRPVITTVLPYTRGWYSELLPDRSLVFDAMPKRSRWIIYGRLDPSDTLIREPGQLIFQQKQVEGFWLTDWMRRHKDRRGPAALEVQRRFSDGRWATDVTAVVPLAEAMERVPAELAKPNGKVFLRP